MYDIVIYGGIMITMEGLGLGIREDAGVAIRGNKIERIGSSQEIRDLPAKRYIDAANKAVLPGLIDAHIHTGFGLLRGLSQDINGWMQKGLWPFYDEVDRAAAKIGSKLNILEAVKAGTTTFNDFFAHMDDLVENHIEIGTRVIATEMVNEMLKKLTDNETGLYRLDPAIGEEKFDRAVKLYEEYDGYNDGMVRCAFGVQAADMISEKLLMRTYEEAVRHNTRFMMHVEQGDREIDQMMRRHGKRTIQYLSELNVLTERLLAVHLTETSYSDTRYLAKKGCALIHCAGTIGLIDGINPPVGEFLEESSRVALGSDHAPGNNCNNMFNEMKLTALLNKNKYKNPAIFPAWQMLKMATIGSARVLGIDNEVGSIREGKKADIILVDLMKPNLSPVITYPIRNVVPNLIYAANGSEVETVIIDGKIVVDDFQVRTVSEASVVSEANEEARKLAARAVPRIDTDSEMMRMFKDGNL